VVGASQQSPTPNSCSADFDPDLWLELYGWPLDEQAALWAIETTIGHVLDLNPVEAADATAYSLVYELERRSAAIVI
jgi:hypothetical protein